MFRGSITALITPFRDGAVDESAFSRFVDWQISEGTKGLVPVGTTGESPTVSHAEHERVIEICVETANKRVPVIAGAGSNSTQEAIGFAKFAQKVGADAILSVTPYYNKPNQDGLFAHFSAIANATDLPMFLYNIPGRSIVDINIDTMVRLRKACPNIVGVKDATADMARMSLQRHYLDDDFVHLTGDDASALGFMAHGGQGCISVTSNIAPKLCNQMQEACLSGDFAKALAVQDKLAPLHTALFKDPNPVPVKYVASLLGLCESDVRLPLVSISQSTKAAVDAALEHAGLV